MINDIRLACPHAFIYCGYSRKAGVAYVGMTIDRKGVLGRWSNHLAGDVFSSSFRKRLDAWDERAWNKIDDLRVFWADIGENPEFVTVETSHRESVEYLVQRDIRRIVAGGEHPLHVISVVRSNPTANLALVRDTARLVVDAFWLHYSC